MGPELHSFISPSLAGPYNAVSCGDASLRGVVSLTPPARRETSSLPISFIFYLFLEMAPIARRPSSYLRGSSIKTSLVVFFFVASLDSLNLELTAPPQEFIAGAICIR